MTIVKMMIKILKIKIMNLIKKIKMKIVKITKMKILNII